MWHAVVPLPLAPRSLLTVGRTAGVTLIVIVAKTVGAMIVAKIAGGMTVAKTAGGMTVAKTVDSRIAVMIVIVVAVMEEATKAGSMMMIARAAAMMGTAMGALDVSLPPLSTLFAKSAPFMDILRKSVGGAMMMTVVTMVIAAIWDLTLLLMELTQIGTMTQELLIISQEN
jgi:hypothetical protein